MARALGVGGVFFKCRDAKQLAEWYRRWLDFPVDPDCLDASFRPETIPPGGYTVWGPFREDTGHFTRSEKEFMFNVMVDNLEGALARVRESGARVLEKIEGYEYGRFGWFVDPEDNKVEPWEPKTPGG